MRKSLFPSHQRGVLSIDDPEKPTPVVEASTALRVWDLPTRVFHGALALAVVGLVITGKSGAMTLHTRLGLVVLALLVFRLAWGLMGGHWSRFATFVRGPATTLSYVRGRLPAADQASMDVGHSPLGALSVVAMLAVLALQVATGLVADDEISTTGPLTRFVSAAVTSKATGWHKGYGQWLVLGLIGLHLAAIAFYTFIQRRRLVAAMVHGDKTVDAGLTPLPASRDDQGSRGLALVVALASLVLAWWIHRLGG